ncbi:MAG: hypothetical protein JXR32_05195, partial [Anaerolineaceae bacterium]|nr:hypothetical protein [Anaerolineaceae bacterium]
MKALNTPPQMNCEIVKAACISQICSLFGRQFLSGNNMPSQTVKIPQLKFAWIITWSIGFHWLLMR